MIPDYVDEVFGARGHLARASGAYEARAGQVRLARAIDGAIERGEHLLAEGPCGTGKSKAYAVPAIRHAASNGRRIVIATAGLALQHQLVAKELPELAAALPWPFSFRLLKGRGNYVCVKRRGEADASGLVGTDLDAYRAVQRWAFETTDGDVATLPVAPPYAVWSKFSISSDECTRSRCSAFTSCLYERAKEQAQHADIVVTNYHVLFASIMLRRLTGEEHLLPPLDVVILDEAHEAADVAREFFGFSVSPHAFKRIRKSAVFRGMTAAAVRITRQADAFFAEVADLMDMKEIQGRLRYPLGIDLAPLRDALEPFIERAGAQPDGVYAADTLGRIEEWLGQTDGNRVYWAERGERGNVMLKAKYLNVGGVLGTELFGRAKSVIACSATLSVGGTFDFARAELGAPSETLAIEVASPFDFRRQARLIVPDGTPDPRDPAFPRAVAESIERVVEVCDGRTLALFTSYRNLNAAYDYLAPRIGSRFRLLKQGDAPTGELTRIFKEDVHSVLLATSSFWTGVDVPGEALTALVIDKLPFPPPDDPVSDAIQERTPNAFARYTIPKTALILKQGVGRLIRSTLDVGVVVLLDPRLISKGYGRTILRSLPDMPLARSLADVPAFLAMTEAA